MAAFTEVELFLSQLKAKEGSIGLVFRDRKKNYEGISSLDVTPNQRLAIIKALKPEDFVSGPHENIHEKDGTMYFVFGKKVGGQWAYIKLSLGKFNKSAECWSFHPAEDILRFPLKGLETETEKEIK